MCETRSRALVQCPSCFAIEPNSLKKARKPTLIIRVGFGGSGIEAGYGARLIAVLPCD